MGLECNPTQVLSIRNWETHFAGYTSNNIHCSCLDGHRCNKISFLFKICNDDDGLRVQTFTAIAATYVNSLSIVKQCRLLQSSFPSLSSLTDEVLCKSQILSLRCLKERILKADRKRTLDTSVEHPSLLYPLKITKESKWMKFWDMSLDHREKGTRAALAILKLLSMMVFGDRKCPIIECDEVIEEGTPVCEHFITKHSDLSACLQKSPQTLLSDLIINCDTENYTDLSYHGLSVTNHLPF